MKVSVAGIGVQSETYIVPFTHAPNINLLTQKKHPALKSKPINPISLYISGDSYGAFGSRVELIELNLGL